MVTLPRAWPAMFSPPSFRQLNLSAGHGSLRREGMLSPLRFLAIVVKLRTELGMRNLDQRLRPFTNRLAVQESDAILSHDIAHQPARSNHSRPRGQHGNDA